MAGGVEQMPGFVVRICLSHCPLVPNIRLAGPYTHLLLELAQWLASDAGCVSQPSPELPWQV